MGVSDVAAGHVFLCYAREDSTQVNELEKALRAAGVPVWRDSADLWPGQDWSVHVRRAITDGALVFLARFSRAALAKGARYQNAELLLAAEQARLRPADKPWLIPVRFDDCPVPDLDLGGGRVLAGIHRADLFGDEADSATRRLVAAVRQILGQDHDAGAADGRVPVPMPRFDADTIRALHPGEAAARLPGVPLDDAIRALIDAPAGRSGRVLEVLLWDNEDLAVALLVHTSPDSAGELIAAIDVAPDWPPDWLRNLPAAVDAIDRCGRASRSHLGKAVGPTMRASRSERKTDGYCRNYEKGQVHWSTRGGAQATYGQIGRRHIAMGGSGAQIGFPLTPEQEAGESPSGTKGKLQRFESRRDYGQQTRDRMGLASGATIYWSRAHGAHATWGCIGEYYELEGGSEGWLGFPVSDEVRVESSPRQDGHHTAGMCQRFEGGTVYYTDKTGSAFGVRKRMADHHERQHKGVTSSLGFPVSPQMDAAPSPYKTEGYFQRFEGSYDYPDDILSAWSAAEQHGGATIYDSETHGTHCVGRGNGVLYERLGGTSSWLGFALSDVSDARTSPQEPWCSVQHFEGGTVFYKEEHSSVTVPRLTMEYLAQHPGLQQRLGFPVSRPPISGPQEPTQFFENGVITMRDGRVEAWLRPEEPDKQA